MAAARRPLDGGRGFVAALLIAAIATTALPGGAHALPNWVRKFFPSGDPGAPPALVTARYTSDIGVSFVLDRSGARPLLKFEDSGEVWVLFPIRAPRGDILYTDDIGELFLRAPKLGGMTVFTASRPEGSAVSVLGPCPPLRLASFGVYHYGQKILQASIRATRATQHSVDFYTGRAPRAGPEGGPPPTSANDGLVVDAAAVAADAIILLAARTGGKGASASLNTVSMAFGARPDVAFRDGVIRITLVPSEGYAGRPSSRRILRAMGVR